MSDFFWNALSFILKIANFVLEVWVAVARLQRFGRLLVTGQADAPPEINLPPEPKPLSPAASRALAEAEERHRDDQE